MAHKESKSLARLVGQLHALLGQGTEVYLGAEAYEALGKQARRWAWQHCEGTMTDGREALFFKLTPALSHWHWLRQSMSNPGKLSKTGVPIDGWPIRVNSRYQPPHEVTLRGLLGTLWAKQQQLKITEKKNAVAELQQGISVVGQHSPVVAREMRKQLQVQQAELQALKEMTKPVEILMDQMLCRRCLLLKPKGILHTICESCTGITESVPATECVSCKSMFYSTSLKLPMCSVCSVTTTNLSVCDYCHVVFEKTGSPLCPTCNKSAHKCAECGSIYYLGGAANPEYCGPCVTWTDLAMGFVTKNPPLAIDAADMVNTMHCTKCSMKIGPGMACACNAVIVPSTQCKACKVTIPGKEAKDNQGKCASCYAHTKWVSMCLVCETLLTLVEQVGLKAVCSSCFKTEWNKQLGLPQEKAPDISLTAKLTKPTW